MTDSDGYFHMQPRDLPQELIEDPTLDPPKQAPEDMQIGPPNGGNPYAIMGVDEVLMGDPPMGMGMGMGMGGTHMQLEPSPPYSVNDAGGYPAAPGMAMISRPLLAAQPNVSMATLVGLEANAAPVSMSDGPSCTCPVREEGDLESRRRQWGRLRGRGGWPSFDWGAGGFRRNRRRTGCASLECREEARMREEEEEEEEEKMEWLAMKWRRKYKKRKRACRAVLFVVVFVLLSFVFYRVLGAREREDERWWNEVRIHDAHLRWGFMVANWWFVDAREGGFVPRGDTQIP